MRRSLARLFVTSVLSTLAPAALAEDPPTDAPIDWAKDLRADKVVTKGKTWVIDEHGVLDFGSAPRKRLHMRWHAEAPSQSFVSRDSFVAVYNAMQTTWMLTFVVGDRQVRLDDLSDYAYEPLPVSSNTASGPTDIEIRMVLTPDGVDVSFSVGGAAPKLRSMAWGEIYKKRVIKREVSGARSMLPAERAPLPPTCRHYLDAFRSCVAAMPESTRPFALKSVTIMEDEWRGIEDRSRLEPACKDALDAARANMKSVCPNVVW